MGILDNLKESLKDLGTSLNDKWARANAGPPSFDHLSDYEHALSYPVYTDFLDKAERGYFDEDITRDFRRFLSRLDLDKKDIDSATYYLERVAQRALPINNAAYHQTQNKFWQETGLSDTRAKPLIPFVHRAPPL